MAVVVTARSGYDLGYVWKGQRERHAEDGSERTSSGGYYIDATQQGEAPGRWFGAGAKELGFQPGQVVEREPYEKVYRQTDPRTGERLGRSAPGYAKFRDHLSRLAAAEPRGTFPPAISRSRSAACWNWSSW